MTKIDPIIAVKDVATSARWYQAVFNCKNAHGGETFAVLVAENDEVLICLHKWGEHDHPTMINPNNTPGNGLIFYFRTEKMDAIRQNLKEIDHAIEEEIHLNPNTKKMEFSVRDPDGYFWIITEFHKY